MSQLQSELFNGGAAMRADAPTEPDEGFAKFWSIYPSKVAKVAAARAWRRLKPGKALQAHLLDALELHKVSDQWQRGFVPHPATWLNQRRWEDELPVSGGGQPAPSRKTDEQLLAEARRLRDVAP